MDVINAVRTIADAGGLFTRQQALGGGIRSRQLTDLVRKGVIARVARAVYASPTRIAPPLDPAVVAASWQVVISYWSAAAWWGIELPRPVDRVHVTAPRSRGRWRDAVRGVRLHRATVRAGDVVELRGARVTSPIRTAIDIARTATTEDAVAVVDAFMRAGHFTAAEFDAAARRAQGPGRMRIQLVARLIDERAGSVLESLTRVLLWRAGLPAPRTQHSLRHRRTGWIGYLDFAWPDARAALECDGYEYHAARDPFQRDRRRWSALTRAGWLLAVVTWFDVTADPDYVVSLVRDLLRTPPNSPLLNTNVPAVAS
jgi:very-short-patch-repair endonuclease